MSVLSGNLEERYLTQGWVGMLQSSFENEVVSIVCRLEQKNFVLSYSPLPKNSGHAPYPPACSLSSAKKWRILVNLVRFLRAFPLSIPHMSRDLGSWPIHHTHIFLSFLMVYDIRPINPPQLRKLCRFEDTTSLKRGQ